MTKFEHKIRSAFRQEERLTLSEFACKYVKIGPEKLPFDLEGFPWARAPLEDIGDYRHYVTGLIMAAQIGKGRCAEAAIPHFIKNDPGDITWYSDTDDKAAKYAEQRIMPTLKNCSPIKPLMPSNRHATRKKAIIFQHMVFEVLGANETNTQSDTRRIIFCDEVFKWEKGRLAAAISRTSAPHFKGRRKVVITSTGGDEDSDLEEFWRSATKFLASFTCPKCGERHPVAFSKDLSRRIPSQWKAFYLKWDTNETTKPQGEWNFSEVKKTVRYVCPCGHEFSESTEILRHIAKTFDYMQVEEPTVSGEKVCFWCPRMVAGEWATLVEKFLKVNNERKMGFEENFKEFMIKDLAEFWVAGGSEAIEVNASGDYDLASPREAFQWEKEAFRFMQVDCQALSPRYWYHVGAWSRDGESRRVDVGFAETQEQIEAIALSHGLTGPKSINVAVDCGFESETQWAWCARNKWVALRGDDAISYAHHIHVVKNGKPMTKTVMKFYSPKIMRQCGMGKSEQGVLKAAEFLWSNISIKNILSRLKAGTSLYYGIARNIPPYYLEHMDSEYRKTDYKENSNKTKYIWLRRGKRPNHLWDCSCMDLVQAFMAGVIPVAYAEAKTDDSDLPQLADV